MLEDFQVLDMVVCFVVSFELLSWFPRVNSFQDAQATEVLEIDLHGSDCITTSKVLSGFAFLSFLNSFSHISLRLNKLMIFVLIDNLIWT